jgi:hypothetical protein
MPSALRRSNLKSGWLHHEDPGAGHGQQTRLATQGCKSSGVQLEVVALPQPESVAVCIISVTTSLLLGLGLHARWHRDVGVEAMAPAAQRASLVDLYNAAGGAGWNAAVGSTWLTGDPCTPPTWAGVSRGTDANGTTVVRYGVAPSQCTSLGSLRDGSGRVPESQRLHVFHSCQRSVRLTFKFTGDFKVKLRLSRCCSQP